MNAAQVLAHEKFAYAKVEPPCPAFGTCGGCSLQDLAYADQLSLKRERLARTLAALPGLPPMELVGLEEPWRYRNKAELTFGVWQGELALGYHAAGSFWKVVNLDDCLLLPEPAARLLQDVRALAAATGLPAYHPRTHQGFFRYWLVRSSRHTGRLLACLMTAPGPREPVDRMAAALVARHPALASLYWGVTGKLADVAVPEELTLLHGAPYLDDRIGPFALQLHPLSFLQPSTVQAERMYTLVCEHLSRIADGVAWDLYCGVGLIGLYLSRHFRKVYGIDIEPAHLALAASNASLNGVSNLEFKPGAVETLLMDRRFWLQEARPDVIVVDPPRPGLHPQAVSSLLAARPLAIAYLSCNAASLVRDLTILTTHYPKYRISALRAFDMFPQTNHVETVAFLERV